MIITQIIEADSAADAGADFVNANWTPVVQYVKQVTDATDEADTFF